MPSPVKNWVKQQAGRVRRLGAPYLLLVFVFLAPSLRAEEKGRILSPATSTYNAFSQFASFLDTVLKQYSDATNIALNVHTTEALRSFIKSLDTDAELITPAEIVPGGDAATDFGAVLALREGNPVVVSVRDGTTAQRIGLLAGERIAAINDEPTTATRIAEIDRQLDGPAGSKFLLRVIDPATGPRNMLVNRLAPIPPKQPLRYPAQGIGYYRLPEFTQPAVEQFLVAMQRVKEDHPRALILDLRNNPGGSLDAVVIAAQTLLPPKTEVVTLAYAKAERQATFVTPEEGEPYTQQIVVLVNNGTAAEAEIFAAALHDHKRAQLIGNQTAGRGRHIQQFRLPDASILSLPTAYFETPGHQRLHNHGIAPDVTVEVHRDIERKLSTAGYGNTTEADLALARALELLKK